MGLAYACSSHANTMQIPCKYNANTMQIQDFYVFASCKYHARKSCSDFGDMQVHMQVPVLACFCICKPHASQCKPDASPELHHADA
jgi:hypothetical protein